MTRLPTVGGDDNEWGTVLNEYLAVEHNTDGTQKIQIEDVSRTIYIETTGNDTTGDGTSLLPYLTITKALSTIKNNIGSGVVITIQLDANEWILTEENITTIGQFKKPGNINITGVKTLVESGFTLGSAEADDPLTKAVSGGDTASWISNQWQGYFLKSGVQYYPITHNTDISISTTFGNITGTEIYEMQTTLNIEGIYFYGDNFGFYDLYINMPTYDLIGFFFHGNIKIERCKIYSINYISFGFDCLLSLKFTSFIGGSHPIKIYADLFFSMMHIYIKRSGNFTTLNFTTNNYQQFPTNIVLENSNTDTQANCFWSLFPIIPGGGLIGGPTYMKFVNSGLAFRIMGETNIFFDPIFYKIILKNTSYMYRKFSTLPTYHPVQFVIKQSNIYGTPLARWFYDSMYEFTNEKNLRNVRIEGLIYPESEDNISATLTDNATTNVIIGSKTQNRSIIIDYTITRGTTYEVGRLTIVHNGTTLSLSESTPVGDDVGVTFAVAFNTDEIQLQCTLTSTGTGATMIYNTNRVMITPLLI